MRYTLEKRLANNTLHKELEYSMNCQLKEKKTIQLEYGGKSGMCT